MLESALITFLVGAGFLSRPAAPAPTYHLEREPVAGGAELVTVFERMHDPVSGLRDLDVPMLTVLRDSLGGSDPADDRLRYVWILTSTRPTPWQRATSALSFAYFRAGTQRHADRVPAPALDLASPARSVVSNLLSDSVQALRLDPMGAPIRSTTRTYRSNLSDYRKLQIFQALSTLDDLQRRPAGNLLLSDSELRQIYSRLSLSTHAFGGLVRDQSLDRYYNRANSRLEENRGHNWELLRQRAELCGLYFEPLALPGTTPSEALLWIAGDDLAHRQGRRFEGQFLGISNPWTDDRLLHWTGYTAVRYFDSDNRRVPPDTPGARAVPMIPLALYSLDYPRVPLLLADFRHSLTPKRRELVQQGASGLITGVFGITRFGNWPFFAADATWTFVRGRRGAAVNHTARLEAYAEARQFLAVDASLEPELQAELLRQLDHLALNPLENNITIEADVAREQYAALLQYAESPGGLALKLERDRRRELESYTRSPGMRLLASFGRVFTRGGHVPSGDAERALDSQVASRRRAASQVRFLRRLLAASPQPDVVWNTGAIRHAIDTLATEPQAGPQAPALIAQIFEQSGDGELRVACLRALQQINLAHSGSATEPAQTASRDAQLCSTCIAARNELVRLSEDPNSTASWRALSHLYLDHEAAEPAPVPARGE